MVCKNVTNNILCIKNYKENCCQQSVTNMTTMLQSYSKNFSEVNILSSIASSAATLKFNATFVFSNDSNLENTTLQLLVSFQHHNYTVVRTLFVIENARHAARLQNHVSPIENSRIFKYHIFDGNQDKRMVVGSFFLYPEKKSLFSHKMSIMVHINLIQQKFVVIGNLIDTNQTLKVIHHSSATVDLRQSFNHLEKENFKFLISRTNTSSTHLVEIDDIIQQPYLSG